MSAAARTYGQFAEPRLTMTFVVRSGGDPMRLVSVFTAEVGGPEPADFQYQDCQQYVSEQLGSRVNTCALSIFSAAVALVIVGVYASWPIRSGSA
jgi:hypothetical protein